MSQVIRLWKLGNIEGDNPHTWIIPTKQMIDRIRDILANPIDGDIIDIVWGPDISCEVIRVDEPSPIIDKILIPVGKDLENRNLYRFEDVNETSK